MRDEAQEEERSARDEVLDDDQTFAVVHATGVKRRTHGSLATRRCGWTISEDRKDLWDALGKF